jgi:chemotaxis protein methyltransferase CheR
MVRFDYLNLAEDPLPFAGERERIDLILCRNVTIYFAEEATQRLYHRFAEAMHPAGWLLLGPSDPVPAPASTLEVVAFDGVLIWRPRAVERGPLLQPRPATRLLAARAGGHLPRTAVEPGPRRQAALARANAASLDATSMDPLVHLHTGMARLGEGAPAAAIESLRRAAYLDETSALVQFSLGRAYRQLGDPARSRSAFSVARRLLAGRPDDQPLPGGELAAGELRHAVEVQLADLDRTRP